jgi:hypothetical protein
MLTYGVVDRHFELVARGTASEAEADAVLRALRDTLAVRGLGLLIDAREFDPSGLSPGEIEARTGRLCEALRESLLPVCAVVTGDDARLQRQAMRLREVANDLDVRVSLFEDIDRARDWLDSTAPGQVIVSQACAHCLRTADLEVVTDAGHASEPALVPDVYSCPYRDCERLNLTEVPGEIVAVRPRVDPAVRLVL